MNVFQINNLTDQEWTVACFHMREGENIADLDYWRVKREAAKVNWNLPLKTTRSKEIRRVIKEMEEIYGKVPTT